LNETDRLLGNLAGKTDIVLEEKLKIVEQHIAKFETWNPNEAMLNRLRNALNQKQVISGADLSFYYHEIFESQKTFELMQTGLSFPEAQIIAHNQAIAEYAVSGYNQAIAEYAVSGYSIYHPEVIEAFPDEFNHNWRNAWGINR